MTTATPATNTGERMKTTSSLIALALAAAALLHGTARATIVINIEQQGSDVVASYSGSWDTWTPLISTESASNYVSGFGNFQALQGPVSKSYMSTDPMTLSIGTWTETFTSASSFTGDPFGFNLGGDYFAPAGYVAGQSISGSLTFANTDIVTMGFTPDSIGVFSGAGNTVTFSISGTGPAPVPEPGTWAAAALLVGGAALARWRRRQSAAKKKALGA